MQSQDAKYTWYKLDNAAKVFPDSKSKHRMNVFRVAFNLKEEINPDALSQAVEELKERFPTFYVKLKRGLFWYYYEYNESSLIVKPESPCICHLMNFKKNNNYMFNVFYYQKRISVEVFHALSDGTGVVEYTKALVYRYLQILGHELKSEGHVITVDSNFHGMEIEDSFVKNYDNSGCIRSDIERAYNIKGTTFASKYGMGIINGKFPFEQIHVLAKEKDVTLSTYITALIMYSILKVDFKNNVVAKRPVKIMLPVNMRRYYPSKTLRNFSQYTYVKVLPSGKPFSFDELLGICKEQLLHGLKQENMQHVLNANVKIEKSIGLKLIPLFIKQLAIKIAYSKLGNKLATLSFSNLGNIELPKSMQQHIENVEWALTVEKNSTHNVTACTNNGIMNITFNRAIYETEVERFFYSFLAKNGVDVVIESNLWEENA